MGTTMGNRKCKCCKRQAELTMGVCFSCIDCGQVVKIGENSFKVPVKSVKDLSPALCRLKYILEHHGLIMGDED